MIMLMKNRPSLAVSLSLAACVISFVLVTIMFGNSGRTSAQPTSVDVAIMVDTVEDASAEAGYQIATPDPALTEFEGKGAIPSIDVMRLQIDGGGPRSRPVGQSWMLADGSWVRLVQIAGGMGIPGKGDAIDIAGAKTQRLFLKAEDGMPARLALYWDSAGVGFSLCGTLTGSISEEMLIALAASVRPR
ncbi:MAG: hypothetical protein A2147_05805 [Chloroflexi bacterium RBG_16_57_8]|nr:MAG: hypothetical protein A2147_05805 [Chloroflexi bacterium RBG_16_57_8]